MNLISDWHLRHKLQVHHSRGPPVSSEPFFERLVRSHPFQSQLEVYAPVQSLALPIAAFYYKVQLQLLSILDTSFLDTYIRRGSFLAVSLNSRIDSHSSVVLCNGKLRLALDRETYQRLGLEGVESALEPERARFDVVIDLLAPSFRPGKPLYERVRWALGPDRVSQSSLAVSWSLDGQCTAIQFPAGCEAVQVACNVTTTPLGGVGGAPIVNPPLHLFPQLFDWAQSAAAIASEVTPAASADAPRTSSNKPVLPSQSGAKNKKKRAKRALSLLSGQDDSDDDNYLSLSVSHSTGNLHPPASSPAVTPRQQLRAAEIALFHWIGLVSVRATQYLQAPTRSALVTPLFTALAGLGADSLSASGAGAVQTSHGVALRTRGLLHAVDVQRAITAAQQLVAQGAAPWAYVYVWGLPDAPVSWTGVEHLVDPAAAAAAGVKCAQHRVALSADKQHGYELCGEHDYCVVILPRGHTICFAALGGSDEYH